jgi:hypothetical protein
MQTDFIVILSAISPECICGMAAQGGADLHQIAAASVNRGACI